MTTALKTAATALARAQAKAKREALAALMWQHIMAAKLNASCVKEHVFHDTRKWRFDFAWPLRKVALEVDGGVFTGGRHTRGAGFTEDCVKRNTAVIQGWRVINATGEQVKSGQALAWLEALLLPKPVASMLSALDDANGGELAHPKDKPVRSPAYLARVAKLPCARCGKDGRSQAAHSNRSGKGLSLKAGDNYSMPLCTIDDGKVGCHELFDGYKLGTKEQQHEMSKPWILSTYDTLKRAGQVPMNVPRPNFKDDQGASV
jgi:very-short-patch-repair endonuclease